MKFIFWKLLGNVIVLIGNNVKGIYEIFYGIVWMK
jgi:hypothetical protein